MRKIRPSLLGYVQTFKKTCINTDECTFEKECTELDDFSEFWTL